MPNIELPTWHDWPVPPLGPDRYGHFVLLRIDPVASVANLEDEETTRAAALIDTEWMLAITFGVSDPHSFAIAF